MSNEDAAGTGTLVPAGSIGARRDGILFVISAPSGAGKTSLCKELIDFFPGLRHSVSYTTRSIRPGEVEGRDYHFVGRETFDAMVAQGAFAEWAEVHGNRYGTSIASLNRFRASGHDVLLDIDCQGAAQLKRSYGSGVFIFILPPSLDELQRRLTGRNPAASPMRVQKSAKPPGTITWSSTTTSRMPSQCSSRSSLPKAAGHCGNRALSPKY